MKRFIAFMAGVFFVFFVSARDTMMLGQMTSEYIYKYRISTDEARRLTETKVQDIRSMLHTLVDSVIVAEKDRLFKETNEYGNFLIVSYQSGYMVYERWNAVPYTAFMLSTADNRLVMMLRDQNQKALVDADVRYGKRRFRYNAVTQCYELKIPKGIDNVVGNIRNGRWNTLEKSVTAVAQDVFCEVGGQLFFAMINRCEPQVNPHFITIDKPMYQKGDTLRWKCVLIDKDGEWSRDEATVSLLGGYGAKAIWQMRMKPQREGVYYGEIVLDDSLDLRGNRQYCVDVSTKKHDMMIYFELKDYELSRLNMNVEAEAMVKHGDDVRLKVITQDENGRAVENGRLRVSFAPNMYSVAVVNSDHMQIPEQFAVIDLDIADGGETEVVLESEKLPCADYQIEWTVEALMLDGQTDSQSGVVDYTKRLPEEHIDTGCEIRIEKRMTADSVYFEVDNKDGVEFRYSLYRNNKVVRDGFVRELAVAERSEGEEVWDLVVSYVIDGQLRQAVSSARHSANMLNVKVNQPHKVRPGEKVEIVVRVTDNMGRPVPFADVTAQAHTAKFRQTFSFPMDWKERPYRMARACVSAALSQQVYRGRSDENLSRRMSLDSLDIYRLLNPGDSIFFCVREEVGLMSQVAPFVANDQRLDRVMYVLIDNEPVYFDAQGAGPYSFKCRAGHHDIIVRTYDAMYTIRNVEVGKYAKTWLSVGKKCRASGVEVKRMPKRLTKKEKYWYTSYYSEQRMLRDGIGYFVFGKDTVAVNTEAMARYEQRGWLHKMRFGDDECVMPWSVMPFTSSTTDWTERYRIVRPFASVPRVPKCDVMDVAVVNDAVTTYTGMYTDLVQMIDDVLQWVILDSKLKERRGKEEPRLKFVEWRDEETTKRPPLLCIVLEAEDGTELLLPGKVSNVRLENVGVYRATYLWADSTAYREQFAIADSVLTIVPYNYAKAVRNGAAEEKLLMRVRNMADEYIDNRDNYKWNASIYDSSHNGGRSVKVASYGVTNKSAAAAGRDVIDQMDYDVADGNFEEESRVVADVSQWSLEEMEYEVRSHFADVGFWCPDLMTDINGECRFSVEYPDDATRWKQLFVAMCGKRRGYAACDVTAALPVEARLNMPRFVVEGDSVVITGETQNYTGNVALMERRFAVDDVEVKSIEAAGIESSVVDTLAVVVPMMKSDAVSDSIAMEYAVRGGGQSDGERRMLARYAQGLEMVDGMALMLGGGDTALTVGPFGCDTPVEIGVYGDILPILIEEIEAVKRERTQNNDALASQLYAFLLQERVARLRGTEFNGGRETQRLIRQLMRNRADNRMWAWWGKSSDASLWVSEYVYRVLGMAQKMGYRVDGMEYVFELQNWLIQRFSQMKLLNENSSMLRIVEILSAVGRENIARNYFEMIERDSLRYNDILRYDLLCQTFGREVRFSDYDTIRHQGILGDEYYDFANRPYFRSISNTSTQTSLLVYRMLMQSADADKEQHLDMIEQWLVAQRRGFWANHYEGMQIVDALLMRYERDGARLSSTMVQIAQGSDVRNISEMPYRVEMDGRKPIAIKKSGSGRVYMSLEQRHFEKNAASMSGEMAVETRFFKEELALGETADIEVVMRVGKAAEYVVLTVPIPAGCGYAKNQPHTVGEIGREENRGEVNIYCGALKSGEYRFVVRLDARFAGCYTVNPAQARLVYFPAINANDGVRQIKIK